MSLQKPTIKGIFVNSHIHAVREKLGEEGVRELEKRYGKSVSIKNSDNIPLCEEVKILECALDLLTGRTFSGKERSYEAGRLHFRNFTKTPLAKILFPFFRKNFKLMMLHSRNIAGHIFRGVKFSSEELGVTSVRIVIENNDYPIDHFRGLFQEWMEFAGMTGIVEAYELKPDRYEYVMNWKDDG